MSADMRNKDYQSKSEIEILEWGRRREVGSWFQRRGEKSNTPHSNASQNSPLWSMFDNTSIIDRCVPNRHIPGTTERYQPASIDRLRRCKLSVTASLRCFRHATDDATTSRRESQMSLWVWRRLEMLMTARRRRCAQRISCNFVASTCAACHTCRRHVTSSTLNAWDIIIINHHHYQQRRGWDVFFLFFCSILSRRFTTQLFSPYFGFFLKR